MSVQTPIPVIPPSLTYETLNSLVSSSKRTYKKNPSNGTSFTSGDIVFPFDKMANTFLNPGTTMISGTVTFNFPGTATNADPSALIGSAYSFFQNQLFRTDSNVIIDNIPNVGQLVHNITNQTTNFADSIALSNMTLATASSPTLQTALGSYGIIAYPAGAANTPPAVNTFSFCIPLIGAINSDRLLPLYLCKYEMILTLAQISNIIRAYGTAGRQATSFTLSNMEIVGETLELDADAFRTITSMYPSMSIKTESYAYCGTSPLAAGTGIGMYEFPIGINASCAKRVIVQVAPADGIDKVFAGVNPNLQGVQMRVNGNRLMPSEMVNATKAAAMYAENQKAWGSLYSPLHSGGCPRVAFCRSSTAAYANNQEWKAYMADAGTQAIAILTGADAEIQGNKYCMILDLVTLNQASASFNGIKLVGGSSAFRMQIAAPLAAVVHNVNMWVGYDLVMTFDNSNQIVSVMM